MNKRFMLLAIVMGIGVAGVFYALTIKAQPALSAPLRTVESEFALLEPDGINDILPEARDYASEVWGDPWDMNEITDIYNEKSYGFEHVTVEDGILHGITNHHDPYLFLLWAGYEHAPNFGKFGSLQPINADVYDTISFRMYASEAGHSQLYWFAGKSFKTDYSVTRSFDVFEGWHIYTMHLPTADILAGFWPWAGEIQGLRLDPIANLGVEIALDWVRLTPANSPETVFPITWGEVFTGTQVDLVVDDDTIWENGTYMPLAEDVLVTDEQLTWQSSILPPGNYYIEAEVQIDFADIVLGDAWDMVEETDILQMMNIKNSQFISGTWSFDPVNAVPHFWPNFEWFGRLPIDADLFTQLTMRMYSSDADSWTVAWWDINGQPHDYPLAKMDTYQGWHTYTIDLKLSPDWTGLVRNLQIRPAFTETVHLAFDWISLTVGPVPAAESELYTQHIYSAGPVEIVQMPLLNIIQPSMTSGADFATEVLGNAWDMNNRDDISQTADYFEMDFEGGIFSGRTGRLNDAQVVLNMHNTLLNASRYRYLTYRIKIEGRQDTLYGWVARLIWRDTQGEVSTVRDLVVQEGWNDYTIDLATIPIVQKPESDWTGWMRWLRFDPHEMYAPAQVLVDSIYIRAKDEADASFMIRWDGTYAAGTQVSLYYDIDTDSTNKILIAANIAASALAYEWNTSVVNVGEYYIYILANDGFNQVGRYSESPVVISHPLGAAEFRQAAPQPIPASVLPHDPQLTVPAELFAVQTFMDLQHVRTLVVDGESVWAGTRGGLVHWDASAQMYTRFGTEHGLANPVVNDIVIDPTGVLWAATANGISRYDGQSWKTLLIGDTSELNWVHALAFDSQARLWAGTDAGMAVYDNGNWQVFGNSDGLPNSAIRAVAFDTSGKLWAGTDGAGLVNFDGQNWTVIDTTQGFISDYIWQITPTPEGGLWVGTYNGIAYGKDGVWKTYTTADGLGSNNVRDVQLAATGDVWAAGMGGGVSVYDGTTWSQVPMDRIHLDVNALALTPDGAAWAGSALGLVRYAAGQWEELDTAVTLPDNYITSIVKDANGIVWVGTFEGLSRYDGQFWKTYTKEDGLSDDHVQSLFAASDGRLWVGTEYGLNVFDGENWEHFFESDGLLYNNITSLAVDHEGNVWAGTWVGVSMWDGETWTNYLGENIYREDRNIEGLVEKAKTSEPLLVNQYVYDIAVAADGKVWVATLGGLSIFEGDGWTHISEGVGLIDKRILSLDFAPDGALWVGSYLGVSRLQGGVWTSWSVPADTFPAAAPKIKIDPDTGEVWAGTYGCGSARFTTDGWEFFGTEAGVSNQYVFALLPQDGTLWTGGFDGLSFMGTYSLHLPMILR